MLQSGNRCYAAWLVKESDVCFQSILDNTKSAENSSGGPSKNNDFMHIYGRDILGTQNC